jgi:hypothetical protein
MSAIQLGFTLRTSANVKTVHLLGSWDNYAGQLPLSKDAAKAGSWKGTFRFQGATLQAGQRYWYYYIMDGYHVSHDPAKPSTKEPTTGRSLNILDVPASATTAPSHKSRKSVEIPVGRALSPGRILHPKPSKPYASRGIREADYNMSPDELAEQLEEASLHGKYSASPASSISSNSSISDSSISSRSNSSSLSSFSSLSSGSACTCNRYGITRKGDRVKLNCGGSRCGSGSELDCSDSEREHEVSTRRHGVVIR